MNRLMDTITYWAISWVRWRLRRDKRPGSWYASYHDNISMVIQDEFKSRIWPPSSSMQHLVAKDFGDTCARTFMDRWVDDMCAPTHLVNKWLDPDR
jgi:hypothetical protein